MHRRKLPIGIQTFAKIREDDHYYVDKTDFIRQLTDQGTHYFLSRPRRFGKSLLLDTLGELFAGNEPLFRREFRTWWFETGTPTFLIDQLTERGFFTPRLAGLRADEALLSAFDVDRLAPEALLWQTGYLTDRHRVQPGTADPGRVRGGDRLTGMGSPIRSASARRVGESQGAG